jgi:thiamine-phosphate pyrophosphorylase
VNGAAAGDDRTGAPSALGPLLVLTDRAMSQTAGLGLLRSVTEAVEGGARTVVLREKDLPWREREAMAVEVAALLQPQGAVLVVASDPGVAARVGTAWLHLAENDPLPPAGFAWGRSCHDADDVRRAAAEGAAYVTISPVFATVSKPGYGPPIGPSGVADAVAAAGGAVDVYALGGIAPDRAAACVAAGAGGVAVMGEVMRSARPGATVAAILERIAR